MRDSKGRFIPGHKVLPGRDLKTGKFIAKKLQKNSMDSKYSYSIVSKRVDMILKEHEED